MSVDFIVFSAVATSSPNAVLIRTSSSGCLTVINPSGTTSELSHINSGQHSLHGANDNSSLSISSTTVSKPVLTVIPNPTGTQTKIIRPSLAQSPKVGLIPNSQLQTRSNVPVTQQYQPRPTIQSNPTPVISKVQSFAQGSYLNVNFFIRLLIYSSVNFTDSCVIDNFFWGGGVSQNHSSD